MIIGIAVVVIVILLWMIVIYNRLVTLRNDVAAAWHQIDVQLKRRHDLIPNLVSVVKGYMDFERSTLERVVSARTRALSAVTLHDKATAEGKLTEALRGLLAVIEGYPVLKSNTNILELQEELTSTENRIAFARQFYNDLVALYRTRLGVFPDTVIATLFAFKGAGFFSAGEHERTVPSVDAGIRMQ